MIWIILATLIFGAILLQGLRKIPENPPHLGQKTFLGRRIPKKYYKEGWGFFLFYPFLYGFVLVKVARVVFQIVSEETRTPDRAKSRVPVLITFRAVPTLLVNYLNSETDEGVKTQLTGKITERIREWAFGTEEGPADWRELNQSQFEGTSILAKEIAENSLTRIPEYAQEVPTWIWLRFFSRPQPTRFLTNEQPWAALEWQRVREVLERIKNDHGSQGVQDLQNTVEQRRREIEALRTGSGEIVIEDLGIRLERLNLGDIDALGEVGEVAEEEAKEEQQRKAEELELRFVRERIAELMLPPFNYTNAEARDIVQTERGKVVKTINDQKISLDTTTAQIVANVLNGGKKIIGGN